MATIDCGFTIPGLALLLVAASGCGPGLGGADTDTDSGGTDGPSDSESTSAFETFGESGGGPEDPDAVGLSVNRDVDILFVIDNSGSMGHEQQRFAQALSTLVDGLEAPEVAANYRLAFTTTDNGNYWCRGQGVSTPEAGQFVLSSCQSRLDDFYFSGTDTLAEFACTDSCSTNEIATVPTTTADDPTPRSRPWIERTSGETNLANGVSALDAARCVAPMGINGCGFESHLESMWKALKLPFEESQDEFGFLRDSAALSIVFLTDEADCSFNREHETEVFGEGGPRTFWSLPDEQQSPSSAVCWNAGVSCTGSGTYDDCSSADLDPLGNEVTSADEASLFPVAKYVDYVNELELDKREINPLQEVLVQAIVGVPQGYPSEPLVYREGPMANDLSSFQTRFGVGQGCTTAELDGSTGEAVPPVRLREFAEWFAVGDGDVATNMYSVCRDDYSPAMGKLVDGIRDQLRPTCMPACVQDTDPATPGSVEPDCELFQRSVDESGLSSEISIPKCDAGGTVPGGEDVCYVELSDKTGATPSPDDDMTEFCADEGWNLEFRIVRAEGNMAPPGAAFSALCELSENRPIDCPDLP